jgi:glutamate racemase
MGERACACVFDSGLGGLSVVRELVRARLGLDISYCADTAFFPYGQRQDGELLARLPGLLAAVQSRTAADVLVIACNTASTIALDAIRARTTVPVVGVVPAVKPAAAATRTGTIGLLATPRTVARPYTDALIAEHARGVTVLRHGPPDLALAAEAHLRGETTDPDIYTRAMAGLIEQPGGNSMDTVVLACTHYPFVATQLEAAADRLGARNLTFLDSGHAIARRVASLTGAPEGEARLHRAWSTGGDEDGLHAVAASFGFARGGIIESGAVAGNG